jgi:hypothetical protein
VRGLQAREELGLAGEAAPRGGAAGKVRARQKVLGEAGEEERDWEAWAEAAGALQG